MCKLFSKYDNEFEEMYLKKINLLAEENGICIQTPLTGK